MKIMNSLQNKKVKKMTKKQNREAFAEEETVALEEEFINLYSGESKNTIKILFGTYKRYPLQVLGVLLFCFLAILPHIVIPIITANFITIASDAVAGRSADYVQQITINALTLVGLLLLNIPTNIIRVRLASSVARKAEVGLRGAIVRKLQQLSISFHKEMQSGRIQSKLMRDVETVHSMTYSLLTSMPEILISLLTALIVVINRSMTIFGFFVLCIPAAVIAVRAFRTKINNSNREFRRGMEETSAGIMDMVEMTEITRAHALENKEIKKINQLLGKMARTGLQMDTVYAIFGATSWVIFQCFQLICLIFSVYMAISKKIELGEIALYQSYFSTITTQVSAVIGFLPAISKGFESMSSIGEILSSDDIEDNRNKKKVSNIKGEYEFKNVEFEYVEAQPLLKGLNLKVQAGETIAFVGESGAGKSTILNLILGFNVPRSGEVLIDGKNIKEIDLHSYRKNLAVVPQNSVMFTGTIRENITYGMDGIDEKRLRDIIEAARLADFVDSLPQGVDTRIEEHGANLSGGQRQRISIARALIRDPRVIIFDEATSALDSVSEKEIQKAINNISKDRTTFIVAHRLSTIKEADRIAVIKDGRCVEIGNFDELVAKKGEFYRMQALQTI